MSVVARASYNGYDWRNEQNFREWTRRNIDATESKLTELSEQFRFGNIPEYADDTAAGAGGLVQGAIYRTAAGALMVKL